MKKLIFMILSLGMLFTSNASADGFCQNWEHGEIVPGGQQPNGSTAPKPFCWQISDLTGAVDIFGTKHIANEYPVQGKSNSNYNFFGAYQDYSYGELYVGIYVYAEVYGYPQNTPKVTFNHHSGILKSTNNVLSSSGNIINGTRYKFFIPIEKPANISSWNDLDLYGTVRIFDGVTPKGVNLTIY